MNDRTTFVVISLKFKCAYFRIFGYGLWIGIRHLQDGLLFSEYYGYTKFWQFGSIRIKPLTPRY